MESFCLVGLKQLRNNGYSDALAVVSVFESSRGQSNIFPRTSL
jgi:hypothetical protein